MQQIKQTIFIKGLGLYLNLLSHIYPRKGYALAYSYFSRPRKGRLIKEALPELLQKAEQQTHIFGEQQFQTYKWLGNDEVLLLVHGWESNANRWSALMKQLLPTGKTIIAIDGPAHGLSGGIEFNVPMYAEFINIVVQKFQPKFLIGHSIGGTASVYYQYLYPNHPLKKMVVLGAPCDFSVLLQNYIAILSLNDKIHNHLLGYTKERFEIAVEDFSASVFLKNCTIPGIIAHDIEDNAVNYEEGKKLASVWKTAEFISTKGLGHSMHNADLYKKVIAFLEA